MQNRPKLLLREEESEEKGLTVDEKSLYLPKPALKNVYRVEITQNTKINNKRQGRFYKKKKISNLNLR